MKEIKLTQGKVALVSDEDFEAISQYRWHVVCRTGHYYAEHTYGKWPLQRQLKMYHVVADRMRLNFKNKEVDHINSNGLDNRRANLRAASKSENQRNRGKNSNNTTGYKGVYFNRQTGKW